jgi:flavin reductase (DIM6/NTAB) family NADH-FMN oxidoreductase RutF
MNMEPISGTRFREALAQFASGVTVIAARTDQGLVGFTATGFTSASLAPPLVLVCVGKSASAHEGVVGAALFGVSVLGDRQAWIAEQFARSGTDRFCDVALRPGRTPLVEGALVQLECRRYGQYEAGDHTILLGEVVAGAVVSGRPLVRFARRFGVFVSESGLRSGSDANARQGGPG